jgi:hypothetical protein
MREFSDPDAASSSLQKEILDTLQVSAADPYLSIDWITEIANKSHASPREAAVAVWALVDDHALEYTADGRITVPRTEEPPTSGDDRLSPEVRDN